jgi:hypothetical protein
LDYYRPDWAFEWRARIEGDVPNLRRHWGILTGRKINLPKGTKCTPKFSLSPALRRNWREEYGRRTEGGREEDGRRRRAQSRSCKRKRAFPEHTCTRSHVGASEPWGPGVVGSPGGARQNRRSESRSRSSAAEVPRSVGEPLSLFVLRPSDPRSRYSLGGWIDGLGWGGSATSTGSRAFGDGIRGVAR